MNSKPQRPQRPQQAQPSSPIPEIPYESLIQRITELEKKFSKQDKTISEQGETISKLKEALDQLRNIAVTPKMERRRDIENIERSLQEGWQKAYQKTLFQTLKSFFQAHQIAWTHLVSRDISDHVGKVESVLKNVLAVARTVTSSVPIAREVIQGAKDLTSKFFHYKNKKEAEKETNSIDTYLREKMDPNDKSEEDVELSCLGASVKLAFFNAQNLYYAIFEQQQGNLRQDSYLKHIRETIRKDYESSISNDQTGEEKIACNLAIEDAMLVMVDIYLHFPDLINANVTMEDQLIHLVQSYYNNN